MPGSIGHSPSHALQRDCPLSEGAKASVEFYTQNRRGESLLPPIPYANPPVGENSPAGGVLLAMKFAQCFMLTLLRALVSRGTPMTVSTISGSIKVPL